MEEKIWGLTSEEASRQLKIYGPNEIKEEKRFTIIKAFLSQFNNFLVLLLLAASIVSFVVGETLDGVFILAIIILNAFFGLYQEYRAEKSLQSLQKLTQTLIRVIRDGKEQEIDSRYLVPKDIIYLEEGSKIPADGKLIDGINLEVNEAALTGESLPVPKATSDKIFAGTIISRGRGYVKVISTGSATKFGQIAKTLQTIKEVKTPLQEKLEAFTKQVGLIGIIASILVFGLSFIKDKSLMESFLFAISLAVAAVPEGLPAVMTIILAIGVERMAKKKAIVRKLSAIETMGSLTLIATDKTGTLTTNQMRVKKIWVDDKEYDISSPPSLTNHPFRLILQNSALCSTASLIKKIEEKEDFEIIGDTTEGALLIMAHQNRMFYEEERKNWLIEKEIPFSSKTKRMTVKVRKKDNDLPSAEVYIFSKGAPESILEICQFYQIGNEIKKLTPAKKSEIAQEFEQFAQKGLRMIAFSYKTNSDDESLEEDHIFLGFVGIADPVRPEVKEAVKKAQNAGIKVVMITGDNELTAEAVGVETGIIKKGELILTGKILRETSDDELLKILPKVKIFARTYPEDKHRIVKLYQKLGEVVAVTGDGVNDALALKQAEVGVAMGKTGTDVAKDTAHIIITDDNFATLVAAIEQGRNIFIHIKNAIKYLLSCNVGEVIYILFALPLNLPIPSPLQLLYINVATDGLPAISLAFAPDDKKILEKPPRKTLTILDRVDFHYVFAVGFFTMVLATFSIFIENSTTGIFSAIIFIQQFILVDLFLSHRHIASNYKLLLRPIFLLAFLFPFLVQPFILNLPLLQQAFKVESLNWEIFFILIGFSSLILLGIRGVKEFLKI
ncbi:MAG: calcium-translocating P-type ATPase, PMCA-type [Patescibacteria group bacterium]|nr:calcium-translocating P-type ATPase, PMCA-type [Patescibacteria group bacterium]